MTLQSDHSAVNFAPQTDTVADIMVTDVITTKPSSSLHFIEHLLKQNRIHHLIVEESRRVVGIISDRDVLSSISPFLDTEAENYRDVRTMHLQASEIMTPDPICIEPTTTIAQAAVLLLRHNISALPVTDAGKTIKGIVTWKDLLWFYVNASKPGTGKTR